MGAEGDMKMESVEQDVMWTILSAAADNYLTKRCNLFYPLHNH